MKQPKGRYLTNSKRVLPEDMSLPAHIIKHAKYVAHVQPLSLPHPPTTHHPNVGTWPRWATAQDCWALET